MDTQVEVGTLAPVTILKAAIWPLVMSATAAMFLAPGLMVGPSFDAAVFSVIGLEVTHGAMPYQDVWDHKPPLTYLFNAAGHLLGSPNEAWSFIWLLTMLSTSLAAVVVTHTVERSGLGRWPARVAGLMVAAAGGTYFLALGGGMTESLVLLPLAGATLIAADTTSRRPHRHFMAGLLVGVALAITPQAAAAGCGVLVLSARSSRRRWMRSAWLVAGVALVTSVLVLGLLVLGALEGAIDALVRYSSAYRLLGAATLAAIPWLVLSLLPVIALAAFGVLSLRRARTPAVRTLGYAALVWLLAWTLLVALQNRLYAHYVITILPPLAYLAAIGADDLSQVISVHRRVRIVAHGAAAMTASIALVFGWVAANGAMLETRMANATADAVGGYLSRLAAPGDELMVWGNQPSVYLASGLRPSSRFIYFYPLSTPGYATGGLVASFAEEMDRRPPRFIVDAGSRQPGERGYLPLLRDRSVWTDGRNLDLMEPIRGIVAERYLLADIVQGWPVYVLRETATSP